MQLKSIRISQGLSIPKLSKLSGVPVRTIENVERTGKGNIDTAIKLADALGVTLDALCRKQEG